MLIRCHHWGDMKHPDVAFCFMSGATPKYRKTQSAILSKIYCRKTTFGTLRLLVQSWLCCVVNYSKSF
jgi:hypothetical protein